MILSAFLVAQTTGQTPIPWGDILKFGITPVIVLVLIITGVLRVGTFVDKEANSLSAAAAERLAAERDRADKAEKRAEDAEERERRLRDAAADIGPAFRQSSATMDRILDYLLRTQPGSGGGQS